MLAAYFSRALSLCLGLLLASSALHLRAQTLELSQAQAWVTVLGQTTQQAVSLPYHWDQRQNGRPGEASFEIPFVLPVLPSASYGLYIPRLGNAYEVWLNGVLLQHNGDMQQGNGADYAKSPRYVEIQPGSLHRSNLLRIRIRADIGRRGGLAPMTLGPAEEVHAVYLKNYRWRSTGSFAITITGLVVGLMALALWASQVDTLAPDKPRRDPLYLHAGLAQLFGLLVVVDVILDNPPLSWLWWGIVLRMAVAIWMASTLLFCMEIAGWSRRPAVSWLRCWLGLLAAGSVVAGLVASLFGHTWVLTLWYSALAVTVLATLPALIWKATHGGSGSQKLVTAVLLLNGLLGLRDLIVVRISSVYAENTLLRYGSLLFALTLGYVVTARFRAALLHARDFTANLARQVASKEDELAQTYQRFELLAREQERTAERTRILRDMHDGVGSHISTAIRQLEAGRSSSAQVVQTLRDSLDQLKLSVDAMNLPEGDIGALLASMRYRLEPRFAALDVRLIWEVEELAPVPRLDGAAMRQMQLLLFEALSNVLQHARAHSLRIRAQPMGSPSAGVRLQIIDDGVGFDVDTTSKKGLRSMTDRAVAIGAILRCSSQPGRTVIEISVS